MVAMFTIFVFLKVNCFSESEISSDDVTTSRSISKSGVCIVSFFWRGNKIAAAGHYMQILKCMPYIPKIINLKRTLRLLVITIAKNMCHFIN